MTGKVHEFIKKRTFINVATCSLDNKPSNVSKLVLKLEHNNVYLVDYSIGKTYRNLKHNPYASLAFFEPDKLIGFQLNGPVEVIESGEAYEKIAHELTAKEVSLSTERILKAVTSGQKHESFELVGKRKFVIFKVKVEEIVEISYSGEVKREHQENKGYTCSIRSKV